MPYSESTWVLQYQFLDQEGLQEAIEQDQPKKDTEASSSGS